MVSQRVIESVVGLFLLLAIACLTVLAFKVSGLTNLFPLQTYSISADFDDIGGLKIRAPVKISGVQIGEVESINLDPTTFKAKVIMQIKDEYNNIPDDSSAGIFTAGLLGDNYIAIAPMYSETPFKADGKIEITQSAMVLEKLIGQFIYSMKNDSQSAANGDEAKEKSVTTQSTQQK